MDIHTHIVLTETNLKVAKAERHAELVRALAEARATQPSLRVRTAALLIAVASKLSPEAVSVPEKRPYPQA